MTPENAPVVQIDIVSDVMCPWCIVGYRQLEQALAMTGMGARVRWHPFELNPTMPEGGQNLTEHLAEKYGATPEQGVENRTRLTDLGATLGITFTFSDQTRIVNTFAAHQLLDWAEAQNQQHPLKLALFTAHFTDGRDVSDPAVLAAIAGEIGLDATAAAAALSSGDHAEPVRRKQQFWTSRGISGVPSIVFDERYLLTGAMGAETYAQMLQKVAAEQNAA